MIKFAALLILLFPQMALADPPATTLDFTQAEPQEAFPAGSATVPRIGGDKAFSAPLAGLSESAEVDFKLGNALFRTEWQVGNSVVFGGLGPNFNARSCVQCHVNDGRGRPLIEGRYGSGTLLLKIGMVSPDGATTLPDPNYGSQLQDFAIEGIAPEYRLRTTYETQLVALSGGKAVQLRKLVYHLDNLRHGSLHPNTRISARIAPQMIGLGLIEAILEADILLAADPTDHDNDGISGRANKVVAVERASLMLGRFGLKAASPSIRQQTAAAFAHDIGISNGLIRNGAEMPEISAETFDFVAKYSAMIGVPARKTASDATVLRGKQLFYESGCISCHQPKFITRNVPKHPELSAQLIWPYSDFLLHDMGAGLADQLPEGQASGAEWRTAPLWGIGLTQQVSGHSSFLHDGRARSLLEAILWHGGEAQAAQNEVVQMPAKDRAALIRFLESL